MTIKLEELKEYIEKRIEEDTDAKVANEEQKLLFTLARKYGYQLVSRELDQMMWKIGLIDNEKF
jgi:hypothetical protein